MTTGNLFDAKGYRIPNQLIILGYLAGLFLNIQKYQLIGIVYFLISTITSILMLMLLYMSNSIGAGDIKLFSVMSGLVGLKITVDVMIASVMVAAVAVMGILLYEGKIDLKRKLHYSYYISAGFFLLQLNL